MHPLAINMIFEILSASDVRMIQTLRACLCRGLVFGTVISETHFRGAAC